MVAYCNARSPAIAAEIKLSSCFGNTRYSVPVGLLIAVYREFWTNEYAQEKITEFLAYNYG